MKNIFKNNKVKTEKKTVVTDNNTELGSKNNHNQHPQINIPTTEKTPDTTINFGRMTKKQLLDHISNQQKEQKETTKKIDDLTAIIAENARLKQMIAKSTTSQSSRKNTTNKGNALVIMQTFIGTDKPQPIGKVTESLATRANKRFLINGKKYIDKNPDAFDGIDTSNAFDNIFLLPCGRQRKAFSVTPDELHEIGKFAHGSCFNALTTDFSWQYKSNGWQFVDGNFDGINPDDTDENQSFAWGGYPIPYSNKTTKEFGKCNVTFIELTETEQRILRIVFNKKLKLK